VLVRAALLLLLPDALSSVLGEPPPHAAVMNPAAAVMVAAATWCIRSATVVTITPLSRRCHDAMRSRGDDSPTAPSIAARISASSTARYRSVVATDSWPSNCCTARRLRDAR